MENPQEVKKSTRKRRNRRTRRGGKSKDAGKAAAHEPPALPPLEERIPEVFLDAMRGYDKHTSTLLNMNKEGPSGLLPALQHLNQIQLQVPGQRYKTTALCKLAQDAFPNTSKSLRIAQYKKRSIETMVRDMKFLDRLLLLPSPRRIKPPRVVLLGDSMFERFTKRERILRNSNTNLYNFSVGGDGVEHLLCRLQIAHRTYFAHTPVFVLLIGINNVMGAARGNESQSVAASVELIVEGILNIIKFVRENSRATEPPEIYLCKLFHVWGSDTLDYSIINPKVDQVNAALELQIPTQFPEHCHLLPTSMPLDPSNYNEDGLHLSKTGYQRLLTQLPDFVQNHQRPNAFKPPAPALSITT